jgi:hypothetical protein
MEYLDVIKIYVHGLIILGLTKIFTYFASAYLVSLIGYIYPIGIILILAIVLIYPLVIGLINLFIYRCFYDREDVISFPLWTNGLIMFLICSLLLIVYDITKQILILLFIPLLLGVYGRLTEKD